MDTKQSFEDFMNGAMARMNAERKASATNMRLGQFIEKLSGCPDHLQVELEDGRPVHGFLSYRGYYEDLAISPRESHYTARQVLEEAKDARGRVFEGYKGGDFPMHDGSLLWVAPYGESGGNMLTGIRCEPTRVVIETTLHDDYK